MGRDGASDEAAMDGRGAAVYLFADDGTGRVAQHYPMNDNLIFKCLRDPCYAPEPLAKPDAACFLPVEIVDRAIYGGSGVATTGAIVIDNAYCHKLRSSGAYDPEALA